MNTEDSNSVRHFVLRKNMLRVAKALSVSFLNRKRTGKDNT
jgi:hypothetical protein